MVDEGGLEESLDLKKCFNLLIDLSLSFFLSLSA